MSEIDAKALRLCKRISTIDNALGQYSDYEGDKDGPTWHAWKGYIERRAAEAMRLHSQAIMLWGKLRALAHAAHRKGREKRK